MKDVYSITWLKRPLGFDVEADTSGYNNYVSKITDDDNIKEGLKTKSQIITINDTSCVDVKSSEIKKYFRNAKVPITITFLAYDEDSVIIGIS